MNNSTQRLQRHTNGMKYEYIYIYIHLNIYLLNYTILSYHIFPEFLQNNQYKNQITLCVS